MDFDISVWLQELTDKLLLSFSGRVIFIGHTGSYARGEATASSDIDVNVVLDVLDMNDLQTLRRIIKSMPESDKACGFICGKKEITAWPEHEIFQFVNGCKVLYGSLDGLIKTPTDKDIKDNIKNISSAIYHEVCHRFVYCADIKDEVNELEFAYKTVFYILQEKVFLKNRIYIPKKQEIRSFIDDFDKTVLDIYLNWNSLSQDRSKRPQYYFSCLKDWSSRYLTGC